MEREERRKIGREDRKGEENGGEKTDSTVYNNTLKTNKKKNQKCMM